MHSRPVRWTALALTLVYAGCYTYRPVELTDLAPRAEVRARISAAEAERLAEVLGGNERRELDGTVVETGATGLTLDVPVVSSVERRGEALNQRVSLTPNQVLEVELKELNRTRTGTVVALILGTGLAVFIAQLHGGPGEGPPPPGGEVDMRIPLRIPIPW
ncbi:MAG: hypothetical protein R3E10_09445 [Gemmatimonadota bacterium]